MTLMMLVMMMMTIVRARCGSRLIKVATIIGKLSTVVAGTPDTMVKSIMKKPSSNTGDKEIKKVVKKPASNTGDTATKKVVKKVRGSEYVYYLQVCNGCQKQFFHVSPDECLLTTCANCE